MGNQLEDFKATLKETLLDIDFEIEKVEKIFPANDGGSILAGYQSATRGMALSGMYALQSIIHARLADFIDESSEGTK